MLLIIAPASLTRCSAAPQDCLALNLLGNGDVARAYGAHQGVVAAVAVHEVVVLAALLGVACAQTGRESGKKHG
jgi:hypothetical protein